MANHIKFWENPKTGVVRADNETGEIVGLILWVDADDLAQLPLLLSDVSITAAPVEPVEPETPETPGWYWTAACGEGGAWIAWQRADSKLQALLTLEARFEGTRPARPFRFARARPERKPE